MSDSGSARNLACGILIPYIWSWGLASAARARGLALRAQSVRRCKLVPIVNLWLAGRKTSSVGKFGTSGPQEQQSEHRRRLSSAVGARVDLNPRPVDRKSNALPVDLDICVADSPCPYVGHVWRSRSYASVHSQKMKNVTLFGCGRTLWGDVYILNHQRAAWNIYTTLHSLTDCLFVEFFVLKWSAQPRVRAF